MTEELTNPAPLKGEALLLACRKDPRTYRRLNAIPRSEAEARMTALVFKAMLYRGQHAPDDDYVPMLSGALLDELAQNEYGVWSLSFEEVEWVFRTSVLHKPDFYISVSSLYTVLVDYAKGLGNQLQQKVNKEKQDAERKALRDSAVGVMLAAYSQEMNNNSKPSTK